MVHVDIDTVTIVRPFVSVLGQHGAGSSGHYFSGMPYQQGYGAVGMQTGRGISNVLRSAWRILAPVLLNIGKHAGTEALATGGRILSSLSFDPTDVKGTMKTYLRSGVKNMLRKTGEALIQKGSGQRRKLEPEGPKMKRTKKDILGHY